MNADSSSLQSVKFSKEIQCCSITAILCPGKKAHDIGETFAVCCIQVQKSRERNNFCPSYARTILQVTRSCKAKGSYYWFNVPNGGAKHQERWLVKSPVRSSLSGTALLEYVFLWKYCSRNIAVLIPDVDHMWAEMETALHYLVFLFVRVFRPDKRFVVGFVLFLVLLKLFCLSTKIDSQIFFGVARRGKCGLDVSLMIRYPSVFSHVRVIKCSKTWLTEVPNHF